MTRAAGLAASDGAWGDWFGVSVSQSGSSALVGASGDNIGANTWQGSAYLFRNLDTAAGIVTETAKLIASDGAAYAGFGGSVSLEGDQFLIGATYGDGVVAASGKAYTDMDFNHRERKTTHFFVFSVLFVVPASSVASP